MENRERVNMRFFILAILFICLWGAISRATAADADSSTETNSVGTQVGFVKSNRSLQSKTT